MQPHRHWLDQVLLAVAVHQRGLAYSSLDERYNFPAHLKPLPARIPFFCHYHWPRVLRSEPVLVALVHDLLRATPGIAQKLEADAEWSGLLQTGTAVRHRILPRRKPAPGDLVVTGIPGSGTDYLCGLLAQFDNSIVMDAPDALIAPLLQPRPPWEVAAYVRDVRSDVRDGRPIRNAHRHAGTTADIEAGGDVALYTAHPKSGDFVLAVHNTLSFLCRLDALKRVLPQARFVVCIANPFQTIAAWKGDTVALRDADVATLAACQPDAAWLSPCESGVLRDIASMSDPAERRATLWWWLAQRVLDQAHGVTLVRRDEMVADHTGTVRRIFRGMRSGRLRAALTEPATQRGQPLNDRDIQAIRAICSQAAADLGLRCEE
jgi:hypothetical protein